MPTSHCLSQHQDLDRAKHQCPHLDSLLQQEQWQDADLETTKLLLRAACKEHESWLKVEDIARIPAQAFTDIDLLWMHWSKEHFGFTVQKRIWTQVDKNYTSFGDRIGWRKEGSWLSYQALTFSNTAVSGHLPALNLAAPLPNGEHIFSFVLGRWRIALLARQDW